MRLRENHPKGNLSRPQDYRETSKAGLAEEASLLRQAPTGPGFAAALWTQALTDYVAGRRGSSPACALAGVASASALPHAGWSSDQVAVVLAIIVSVAIAIWQHRDAVRYRRAESERATRVAEQERQRELRRGRQESWEPAYLEIQETLVKLEDIESEVREQGPLDREMIDGVDLGRLQRRLENLSGRCPDTLRVPLREVSTAVAALRSISIEPDRDITSEYAVAAGVLATAGPAVAIPARAIGARAINQYRAALDVHQAIARAWDAIHYERGEKA